MEDIDAVKFERVREDAERFYKEIGEVWCPYFQETISFNAKGLKHLKFKSDRQARSRRDQYMRLKLLRLAPRIVKKSHTLQGIWQTRGFEMSKTNSRWEHIMREVVFYEFIAVVNNVRTKVIVKEVRGGEKHFWSIIPYWSTDKENNKRMLYSGDPEHD